MVLSIFQSLAPVAPPNTNAHNKTETGVYPDLLVTPSPYCDVPFYCTWQLSGETARLHAQQTHFRTKREVVNPDLLFFCLVWQVLKDRQAGI